jgi:glycosyltransferase involved in cell wall biosynthesis
MSNLTLLIPAKKESESLPVFLNELEGYEYEKLIVMDKEDIETSNSIKNFNNIKILHQEKLGYGNALIEGINNIKTEYFCIINADGSMDPSELKKMLSKIQNDNYDVVFASRYMKNAGSDDDDLLTLVGNFFFTKIGKFFFKLQISDILYTYVLGKTKLVKNLNLINGDFKICVELPIKTHTNNLSYVSTPSFERKRIAGKKKVSPFSDGFKIFLEMINLFFKKN